MSCSANLASESKVTYISIYYVKSAEGTCSSGQYIAAVSDLQGALRVSDVIICVTSVKRPAGNTPLKKL